MKERKKFFVNNRLNKGYKKRFNSEVSDVEAFKKNNLHLLPPIEIIEQYESYYPGTFKKLMEMTQKEQQNRHELAALEIKQNAKMAFYGRITGILYIIIIALCVAVLALTDHSILAALFTLIAFSCLYLLAYYFRNNLYPIHNHRKKFRATKSNINEPSS
ncbi:MAG: DUF2335 domain-containing protein [Rickettsiaceae bacterium]|nr:DUF2335 domain-containing protein [Rickettsiaceae bacterium]